MLWIGLTACPAAHVAEATGSNDDSSPETDLLDTSFTVETDLPPDTDLLDTDPVDTDPPVDSDLDGIDDDTELLQGTDPFDADTDYDFLSDGDEALWGTLPLDRDTDNDGLLDGLEVHGEADYDYLAAGCSPLHRDVLVEVDYMVDGTETVLLSSAVRTKLVAYYASLPIQNPDGVDGIHLVLELGVELPPTETCYDDNDDASGSVANNPFTHPARSFHKLSACIGAIRGNGPIGGQRFKIRAPAPDNDPSNDATETKQFNWYYLFLHELGHNLGLHHGGNVELNHKINYPSVMNYRYDRTLDNSPETLQGTKVGYSAGTLAAWPLDGCNLNEETQFSGLTYQDIRFMKFGGAELALDIEPQGIRVDFNRDGDYLDTAVTAKISEADAADCKTSRDVNDFAVIAAGMSEPFEAYWP